MKKIFFIILFILLFFKFAYSATRTISDAGGNWNTTGAWAEGAVPTSSDDVVAQGDETSGNVTITAAAACKSAVFTNYTGTLTHNAAITWTISGNLTLVAGMTYTLGNAATSAITINATSSLTTGGKTIGNFTYDKSGGTLTLQDDLTSSGSLTLTAGTLISCSGTLSVGGDWSDVGGTFTHNSGTIDFTKSSGTQYLYTLGSQTYNNITHSGAGTLQLSIWQYYKQITIQNTYVDATLTDFPVLVYLDPTGSGSGLGASIQDAGQDLRFTSSDGTGLKYEIEFYSEASGNVTAYIWVKVSSITQASGATIYMYYGNSSASAGQDAANVWDTNFKGVWHLPNGTTLSALDSTSNDRDGTISGATATAGVADGGGAFVAASSQYIEQNAQLVSAYPFTMSGWVKFTTAVAGPGVVFRVVDKDATSIAYGIQISTSGLSDNYAAMRARNTTAYDTIDDTALNDGNPHLVTGVFNSATSRDLYVDGTYQVSGTNSVTYSSAVDRWDIGRAGDSSPDSYFNGTIDEVRISDIARAAAWIKFENANMSQSDNELTWGSQQSINTTLTLAGNFTNSAGTFNTNNQNMTVAGNWSGAGTFTAGTGTVTFNGSGAQTISSLTTWYNLTINNTYATPSDTYDVQPSQAQTVTNTLTVSDGQWTPCTGDSYKDVTISANGIMKPRYPNSSPPYNSFITVSGNWSNSGTFTANQSTVTFDGAGTSTISGSTTFYDFTCETASKRIDFTAGTTQTISDRFTVNGGAAGTKIDLNSTTPGTQWNINTSSSGWVDYVDMQDSNSTTQLCASSSTDSGNNNNWNFSCGYGIIVSGTAYSDDGSTTIADGTTIKLAINGATSTFSTTTVDGAFSFEDLSLTTTGKTVCVWIDNNVTYKGNTVTESGGSDLGLAIYAEHLILTDDNSSNSMTNAKLAVADNTADADLLFSVDGSNVLTVGDTRDVELYIWVSETFKPGGTVTVGSATYSSDVNISAGTWDADTYTINVYGNWGSGTFTYDTSTVSFNGSAAQTIGSTTTWYNLTINNTYATPSDTYDVDPSAVQTVTNTLTVTDGQWTPYTGDSYKDVSIGASGIMKPDASASITVSGNWSNSGTFTANSGTVTFTTTDTSVISGSTTFYNLTCTTGLKTINFAAEISPDNPRTTVSNNLNFSGSSGNRITLGRSGGSGTNQWAINPAGTKGGTPGWTVTYVDVSNSINLNANYINPDNSISTSGNTTNWFSSATLVKLAGFYALGYPDKVIAYWQTATEYKNLGFNIYRSLDKGGPFTKLNSRIIPGAGSTLTSRNYSFVDLNVIAGKTYYYLLEDVQTDGLINRHGPVEAHPGLDSDTDQMSDDWEKYYGLNPNDPSDAYLDPDKDKLTNLEEYLKGTNPLISDIPLDEKKNQAADGLRIISQDSAGITLELTTSNFIATAQTENGITYSLLSIPGYTHDYIRQPGAPKLPMKSALIGIPAHSRAVIKEITFVNLTDFKDYQVLPAPKIYLDTAIPPGAAKPTKTLKEAFYPDAVIYSTNADYPAEIVRVNASGFLRDQKVAKISFYPLTFNPPENTLRFYQQIRVSIDFARNTCEDQEQEAEQVLQQAYTGYPRLKVFTKGEGVYKLDYVSMYNAGFYDLIWLDPRTIKLFHQDKEIPIYIKGEEDSWFNPEDYLIFYAPPFKSPYSADDCYLLEFGGKSFGLRMPKINQTQKLAKLQPVEFSFQLHDEANQDYWPEVEGPDETTEHWFSSNYILNDLQTDFRLNLTNLSNTSAYAVNLKVSLWPCMETPKSHRVKTLVNGHQVADNSWSAGRTIQDITAVFPASYLTKGANTISFMAFLPEQAEFDIILVDYIELSYKKRFYAEDNKLIFDYSSDSLCNFKIPGFTSRDIALYKVTAAASVSRFMGLTLAGNKINNIYTLCFKDTPLDARYIALAQDRYNLPAALKVDEPSDLKNSANQADLVIITAGEFAQTLEPLADLRRAQGLSVKVIDIEDIYDEFNDGVFSPRAIKDFLKYAYEYWERPAPTYVLLVGDASYDYKDYYGLGKTNFVPTYLTYTQTLGQTGSDNWLVCLDPAQNIAGQLQEDLLPDMFIGRLPVRTNQELENIVNKIISYEKQNLEDWQKNVLCIVDDDKELGENFSQIAADSLELLPAEDYTATQIRLADYTDMGKVTADITSKINSGALWVNYVGHGSVNFWTSEKVITNSHIAQLTNLEKYPFITSLTCMDGFYLHPFIYECMSEVFLKEKDKGAIACWSSAGMTETVGQRYLNQGLFKAVFEDGNNILGLATTQAKAYNYSLIGGQQNDWVSAWTLFGDPTLSLKIKKEPADVLALTVIPALPVSQPPVTPDVPATPTTPDTLSLSVTPPNPPVSPANSDTSTTVALPASPPPVVTPTPPNTPTIPVTPATPATPSTPATPNSRFDKVIHSVIINYPLARNWKDAYKRAEDTYQPAPLSGSQSYKQESALEKQSLKEEEETPSLESPADENAQEGAPEKPKYKLLAIKKNPEVKALELPEREGMVKKEKIEPKARVSFWERFMRSLEGFLRRAQEFLYGKPV